MGLLVSVLASWRLWTTDRLFPQVPFFHKLPLFPHPWDKVFFGFFLLCIVLLLLFRKPRLITIMLVLAGVWFILTDQNRLQPWFFQYLLMLFVVSFYNWRVDEPQDYTVIYNSLKIIVAAVYCWSGIQKLKPQFMAETWPWLIRPLENICNTETCLVIHHIGYGIPYLELLIAFCLFFPGSKRIAIPLVIFMHLLVFILLSPLAHYYNQVLWGWHLCMVFVVYFLFAGQAGSKYHHISYLFAFKPVYLILPLCMLMPVFNLSNKWYSRLPVEPGKSSEMTGIIRLSRAAKSKLPYYLQHLTLSIQNDAHLLPLKHWAMDEIGVPSYPEPLVYTAAEQFIRHITCCEEEVVLVCKQ